MPRWEKTLFCGMYRMNRMQLASPVIFCGDIRRECHALGPSPNAELHAKVARGASPHVAVRGCRIVAIPSTALQ